MTDRAREKPMFDRVVVKLSGEALMGPDPFGLNAPTVQRISADLKAASELGVQVAVVVGGGNFFRGLLGAEKGIERARADSIGMLATVMNALAMEGALEQLGQPARVLSAAAMPSLCQPYSRQAALGHLVKRRVIVLAGGTGNPFFTTDTGASLRACEALRRRGDEGDPGRRRLHRRPEARSRTPSATTASPTTKRSPATCRSWTPPPSRWRATTASRSSSSRSTSPARSAPPCSARAARPTSCRDFGSAGHDRVKQRLDRTTNALGSRPAHRRGAGGHVHVGRLRRNTGRFAPSSR